MLNTCCRCGKEFEYRYKSIICFECREKPGICVICGKPFKLLSPYTQKTCSPKCRGIYRKNSGIAKQGAAKMKQTKLDRYGTLDPTHVSLAKNNVTQLAPKICPLCNTEFIPETTRQIYCRNKHYGPCPVCGKLTEIKDISIGPQACSEKCRMTRINTTCLERYGNKDAVNSEHAKILGKQHSLERYGKEYYSQTAEYKERCRDTNLKKFGTAYPMQNKEVQAKAAKTTRERYGSDHYSQTEEGKAKIANTMNERYGGFTLEHTSTLREKYETKMLERFGVTAPMNSPELLAKAKMNSLKKYGTEWPATLPEFVNKRIATNLSRYGVEYTFGAKEVREKIKATCIKKFGGPNVMCDPEMAKLASQRQQEAMMKKWGARSTFEVPELRQKIKETMQKRYGVEYFVEHPKCMEHNYHAISKPNQEFATCLSDLGINSTFEFYIGRFSFDIKLADSNVLIEIDPTFTHNAFDNLWHGPKDKDYHLEKSKLAEQNGYRCIHVFDWDNKEAILSMLLPKKKIYARKCSVQQIDRNTAEQFTNLYHLQGSCRGQNLVYGLYYEGELVQMMSFGKARYNKKFDLELLRLCTQTGLQIVGGPSKLFKRFLKDNPTKSVLSYCDFAKFSGKVYTEIGMTLSHTTPPAKVWSKNEKYITDNYLRQLGYDKIFKANYGKGTSNEQLMLEHGWLPVYDCGQKVFVYQP